MQPYTYHHIHVFTTWKHLKEKTQSNQTDSIHFLHFDFKRNVAQLFLPIKRLESHSCAVDFRWLSVRHSFVARWRKKKCGKYAKVMNLREIEESAWLQFSTFKWRFITHFVLFWARCSILSCRICESRYQSIELRAFACKIKNENCNKSASSCRWYFDKSH